MSVLSTIVADVKTFFSDLSTSAGKFSAAFVSLFKKAPAAIQIVQNFVGELAPVITLAVGLADPLIEPEVAGGLALAETGLAAIQASATAATSGTSLLTNIQNFAATVPQLLTGVAIKNPQLQATITKIVTLITGEAKVLIPAVQSWIAQIAASQPAPPSTS